MGKNKNFKWSEARHLWEMTSDILDNHGDMVDDIHICEHEDDYGDEFRKVYCSAGYCLELVKEDPTEDTEPDIEDGKVYRFSEPWDGFKEAGYDGAVEVLSGVCGLKRK